MPAKMVDVKVVELTLTRRPANRRPFLLLKREEGATMDELGALFGVSRRTVFRALASERSIRMGG